VLFTLLLPLFLVSGIGAALARSQWIGGGWSHGVNALTARVLIPALLFSGTYKNGLPPAVSWQVLAAYYLALLALFGLMTKGFRRGPRRPARALAGPY
jgi:malonate transporter